MGCNGKFPYLVPWFSQLETSGVRGFSASQLRFSGLPGTGTKGTKARSRLSASCEKWRMSAAPYEIHWWWYHQMIFKYHDIYHQIYMIYNNDITIHVHISSNFYFSTNDVQMNVIMLKISSLLPNLKNTLALCSCLVIFYALPWRCNQLWLACKPWHTLDAETLKKQQHLDSIK